MASCHRFKLFPAWRKPRKWGGPRSGGALNLIRSSECVEVGSMAWIGGCEWSERLRLFPTSETGRALDWVDMCMGRQILSDHLRSDRGYAFFKWRPQSVESGERCFVRGLFCSLHEACKQKIQGDLADVRVLSFEAVPLEIPFCCIQVPQSRTRSLVLSYTV